MYICYNAYAKVTLSKLSIKKKRISKFVSENIVVLYLCTYTLYSKTMLQQMLLNSKQKLKEAGAAFLID